ncbi:MAG: NEL-type E3 ubiquitin ligase domain-containing protein [Pseudomonadota bacterium]
MPFQAIRLNHNPHDAQLAALQNALGAVWNAAPASAQSARASLNLKNMGLCGIRSAAQLCPRWLTSMDLDNNALLNNLPNDLPDQLRQLSVRNNRSLHRLPDRLPSGLTIEVGGSGLTPEYLRLWTQTHPGAAVRFTNNGAEIGADHPAAVRHAANRARGNFEARLSRQADSAAAPAVRSGPSRRLPVGSGVAAYLVDDDDSGSASESERSVAHEEVGAHDTFATDDMARALAASLLAPQSGGADAHAVAMDGCAHRLAHAMAFWLSEEIEPSGESLTIARQCVGHLYALEEQDDQGAKKRSSPEIVADHVARLDEFAEALDRVKDTASFRDGVAAGQAGQRRKVVDMVQLMASDKELCGTVLIAMQAAASTCPDALATEGLDMIDAMCTTARSIRENWTPENFYGKMRQQLKREHIRTQVNDIVQRMKKNYGAELMNAIEKNHRALNSTFFHKPGVMLADLVNEDHVVRRNGSIRVRHPDDDENATYDATPAERKAYVKLQASKKIDEVEVLSVCQKMMEYRGLLSDVQGSLYGDMHYKNAYSETLNVTSGEFDRMARRVKLTRADVIARMTSWDHWTDFMDRNGHIDAVRGSPEVRRHDAARAAQMEVLREQLADFVEAHAPDHPEAGQDFSLLNNLITTLGTPVVTPHELLRRGGQDANAITFADKQKHRGEGGIRLAQLQAEAGARREREPDPRRANPSTGSRRVRVSERVPERVSERGSGRVSEREHGRDADHHRSRHHGRRTHERGATRRDADATAADGQRQRRSQRAEAGPAQADFEAERLALFKSVVKQLNDQGDTPYEAALLKKTEELVTPYLPQPAPAPTRRFRHTR